VFNPLKHCFNPLQPELAAVDDQGLGLGTGELPRGGAREGGRADQKVDAASALSGWSPWLDDEATICVSDPMPPIDPGAHISTMTGKILAS